MSRKGGCWGLVVIVRVLTLLGHLFLPGSSTSRPGHASKNLWMKITLYIFTHLIREHKLICFLHQTLQQNSN